MISRNISKSLQQREKSILLLGPRQTGKSTLIRSLQPELSINLARESTYLEFARNPNELEERLAAHMPESIFIDEIQRLPSLLNTIQAIIDENKIPPKFYLTGSSARKLRRGNANLLPGRIHTYTLGPIACSELHYQMDTQKALSIGTLPGIWIEQNQEAQIKTLRSYAGTYLKEEIQAESLARNIEGFSRFLYVVANEAGKFLDLSKLSSQAALPRQTGVRYFEILEDTLVIRRSLAFTKSTRTRLIQSPRFFFFDTGVLNALRENFIPSTDRIGNLFEHLIFNQLHDSAAAQDKPIQISSYRTEHGAEVDFIVELDQEIFAIEVKASKNIGKTDLSGLQSFKEFYRKPHQAMVAYLGNKRKKIRDVLVLPWQELLAGAEFINHYRKTF